MGSGLIVPSKRHYMKDSWIKRIEIDDLGTSWPDHSLIVVIVFVVAISAISCTLTLNVVAVNIKPTTDTTSERTRSCPVSSVTSIASATSCSSHSCQ